MANIQKDVRTNSIIVLCYCFTILSKRQAFGWLFYSNSIKRSVVISIHLPCTSRISCWDVHILFHEGRQSAIFVVQHWRSISGEHEKDGRKKRKDQTQSKPIEDMLRSHYLHIEIHLNYKRDCVHLLYICYVKCSGKLYINVY